MTCVDLVDSLSLFFSCQDDSDSTDEMGLFLFCTFLFIALAIFACRACHSSGTLFFILTHTGTRSTGKRSYGKDYSHFSIVESGALNRAGCSKPGRVL